MNLVLEGFYDRQGNFIQKLGICRIEGFTFFITRTRIKSRFQAFLSVDFKGLLNKTEILLTM